MAAGSDVSVAQDMLEIMERSLGTMLIHLRQIESELARESQRR
jgi:hypothetical protein